MPQKDAERVARRKGHGGHSARRGTERILSHSGLAPDRVEQEKYARSAAGAAPARTKSRAPALAHSRYDDYDADDADADWDEPDDGADDAAHPEAKAALGPRPTPPAAIALTPCSVAPPPPCRPRAAAAPGRAADADAASSGPLLPRAAARPRARAAAAQLRAAARPRAARARAPPRLRGARARRARRRRRRDDGRCHRRRRSRRRGRRGRGGARARAAAVAGVAAINFACRSRPGCSPAPPAAPSRAPPPPPPSARPRRRRGGAPPRPQIGDRVDHVGFDGAPWGHIVEDDAFNRSYRLDSGRVAKKATMGLKWRLVAAGAGDEEGERVAPDMASILQHGAGVYQTMGRRRFS